MKEGTPIFPNEPVVVVEGPVIQAQLVETMVLLSINFQSLVTTKANRICRAAQGRPVMEFGSRRAQSYDAAVLGARAAYIGGCVGTACAISDREYQIPALGTIDIRIVQMFPSEYDAFRAYAEAYPSACTLLVDTYNVLKSGIPNAIKVFDEVLGPMGYRPQGVRIDSGDIAYLSKKARKMLDDAGYPDCKIVASNSLDEYLIRDLLLQGAKVDSFASAKTSLPPSPTRSSAGSTSWWRSKGKTASWNPGSSSLKRPKRSPPPTRRWSTASTRRTTTSRSPTISRCLTKTSRRKARSPSSTRSTPGSRRPSRTSRSSPSSSRSSKTASASTTLPDIEVIKAYCRDQVDHLWEEVKRFENPHRYYVDLSEKLWHSKRELLKAYQG